MLSGIIRYWYIFNFVWFLLNWIEEFYYWDIVVNKDIIVYVNNDF